MKEKKSLEEVNVEDIKTPEAGVSVDDFSSETDESSQKGPILIGAVIFVVVALIAAFYFLSQRQTEPVVTNEPPAPVAESDYFTSEDFKVAFNNGELEAIIKDAEALLAENSNDVDALLALAIALVQKDTIGYSTEDSTEKASELIDRVLELDAEHPDAHRIKGYIHMLRGEFEAAHASFDTALGFAVANMDRAEILNNKGDAYRFSGDREAAKAAYEEAIELQGNLAIAILNLGQVLELEGDSDGAFKRYLETVSIAQNNRVKAAAFTAMTNIRLNDPESTDENRIAVLANAERAVRIDDSYAEAHVAMGRIHTAEWRASQEEHEYDSLIADALAEYDDPSPEGRSADAEASFARALELYPGNAYAYYYRGMLRSEMGNAEAATIDFKTAASALPSDMTLTLVEQNKLQTLLEAEGVSVSDEVSFLDRLIPTAHAQTGVGTGVIPNGAGMGVDIWKYVFIHIPTGVEYYPGGDAHGGTDQLLIVPAGAVGMAKVKMWGAGGNSDNGNEGGAGGYVSADIDLGAPGTTYLVMAGHGGHNGTRNYGFSGSGGGLAGIFTGLTAVSENDNNRAVMIAGGGGASNDGRCAGSGTPCGTADGRDANAAGGQASMAGSRWGSRGAGGAGYTGGGASRGSGNSCGDCNSRRMYGHGGQLYINPGFTTQNEVTPSGGGGKCGDRYPLNTNDPDWLANSEPGAPCSGGDGPGMSETGNEATLIVVEFNVPVSPPIVNLTANGGNNGSLTLTDGDNLTLEWSVGGGSADGCASGDDWPGAPSPKNVGGGTEGLGAQSVGSYTYSLTCGNSGGIDSDTLDVTVNPAGPPPTPQCSDTIDNEPDGFTDAADPGCHTDGDPTDDPDGPGPLTPDCPISLDPSCSFDPDDDNETDGGGPTPQCSDTIDNEPDGFTDAADPGCHTDGDPTDDPDGPGPLTPDCPISLDPSCSFDPDDDNETDGGGPTPQCSDTIDNEPDGFTDAADPGCHTDGDPTDDPDGPGPLTPDCPISLDPSCSFDPDDDNETDPPGGPPSVLLRANGNPGGVTINDGDILTLDWIVSDADSCTATVGPWALGLGAKSNTDDSEPQGTPGVGSYTYTLECSNTNGPTSSTVDVTVDPAAGTPPSVELRANGNPGGVTINDGDILTLDWIVSDADSCNATGDWVVTGAKSNTNDSESQGTPSVGAHSYTLTCTNPNGSTPDSVAVTVDPVVPVCGNGVTEPPEQCDDGGTDPGDGCSSVCLNEGGGPPILTTDKPSVPICEQVQINYDTNGCQEVCTLTDLSGDINVTIDPLVPPFTGQETDNVCSTEIYTIDCGPVCGTASKVVFPIEVIYED